MLYRPRERVVCYHVPISILRCGRGGHPIFEMPPRSQGSITDVRSNEDIDLKSKFRFGSSSSSSSTYRPSCNSVCNSTPSCFVAVSWLGLPRDVPARVVRTGHKRNTPPTTPGDIS